ncbi:hypothetical protein D3C81_2111820 [compost metagenome]
MITFPSGKGFGKFGHLCAHLPAPRRLVNGNLFHLDRCVIQLPEQQHANQNIAAAGTYMYIFGFLLPGIVLDTHPKRTTEHFIP